MADFMIEMDENGQRFAVPTSAKGKEWFLQNGDMFDVSDQGIELDTRAVAYGEFLSAALGSFLSVSGQTRTTDCREGQHLFRNGADRCLCGERKWEPSEYQKIHEHALRYG